MLENDNEIKVNNIHEIPYIKMTLKWLNEQGIQYKSADDLSNFKIKGNQHYKSFEKEVPADWSSAAFPLVAGAITQSNILIRGLDINDVQGDKAIIDYLKKMGADISTEKNGIRIQGKELQGADIDLNPTPDALPAMCISACAAKGTTKLYNVVHARIKETDRIKVMTKELSKMGAHIREMDDGVLVDKSTLKGERVQGYNDHRVVMALALAGLIAEGTTKISTAEAVNVTFPTFIHMMQSIGAKIKMEE